MEQYYKDIVETSWESILMERRQCEFLLDNLRYIIDNTTDCYAKWIAENTIERIWKEEACLLLINW